MNLCFWVITLSLLLYLLAVSSPASTTAVVAELKRRWRLYLIKRYGNTEFQQFAAKFRKRAVRDGYRKSDIETLLSQHKTLVIERLGTRIVNAKLGEPTPLERYF
jgi:hypothetical protein